MRLKRVINETCLAFAGRFFFEMNNKDSVGIVEPNSASFKDPLLLECG